MADPWLTRLRSELQELPETLAKFREGVTRLAALTERLEAVTAVLERSREYLDESGLLDAAQQLDEATASFRKQLGSAGAAATSAAADGLQQAVEAFSDTVEALFPARRAQK